MIRARLLAGAAVLVAACALPTAAQAQIGACPTLLPPPCIVIDPAKVASQAVELRNKYREIERLAEQARHYTSIQGALGRIGARANPSSPSPVPIAPLSEQTFAAAWSERASTLQTTTGSRSAILEDRSRHQLFVRAAGGDGYAIAQVMKTRLEGMANDASDIERMASQGSQDLRSDWQANTRARALMMRALGALKEVTSARLDLDSAQALALQSASGMPGGFDPAQPSAPIQAAVVPAHAAQIGELARLSSRLSALTTARQLTQSFNDSIAGFRSTQAEYQQTVQVAQRAQANLQNLANNEARRKRVSASSLMSRANAIMQANDRTTWDNPDKTRAAERAANYAEDQLDRMVSGDVSDDWSRLLRTRAEAYKQEAFFRPIAEESRNFERQTIEAMRQHSQAVGFDISDVGRLNAEIASINAQLRVVGTALDAAPDNVRAQRDAIFSYAMMGTGYDGGSYPNDVPSPNPGAAQPVLPNDGSYDRVPEFNRERNLQIQ